MSSITQFRFRDNQNAYVRWRCRIARRRAMLLELRLEAMVQQRSIANATRRPKPAAVAVHSGTAVLQIGTFVVSQEGDPQLHGHPDIRY